MVVFLRLLSGSDLGFAPVREETTTLLGDSAAGREDASASNQEFRISSCSQDNNRLSSCLILKTGNP